MGFFENFKKKEENNMGAPQSVPTMNNNNLSTNENFVLPPPPLPKKNLSFDKNTSSNIVVPPAPLFSQSTTNASAIPNINSPPPLPLPQQIQPAPPFSFPSNQLNLQESKKEETNYAKTNSNLYEKKEAYIETPLTFEQPNNTKTPGFLPLMPPVRQQTKNFSSFSSSIPSFDIEKEEIPSFSTQEETNIKEEAESLPILEIFDSEEEMPNMDFRHSELKKPLFIRTDYFSQVLSTLDSIKEYVTESPEIISGLENLKKNSDIENRNYKNSLEDIQRKLIYIDKVLFEKEG